ncbi:MAG: hypothetical protein J2P36_22835, partial [Ktedonobacteraceae bacterium]|nr:hypothetical protein [Ktedonobacteraceae bacterium]
WKDPPRQHADSGSTSIRQMPEWLAEQIEYLSKGTLASLDTQAMPVAVPTEPESEPPTAPFPITALVEQNTSVISEAPTLKQVMPIIPETPPVHLPDEPQTMPMRPGSFSHPTRITRFQAILAMVLLGILVMHVLSTGATQFLGNQGWAYVLGGPVNTSDPNLITKLNQRLQQTPQVTATAHQQITPQQYINLLVSNMTLDQKLGQMMIVQFEGAEYSLELSTMINKYNVGAVLVFAANNNIVNGPQLKGLIQQMKDNSRPIPLAVSMDQEGGYVNRLLKIIGPRPAAATIGTTHDPQKAFDSGTQDARDLQQFGINVNLAPVVDVDTSSVSEMHQDLRTFGSTPDVVTSMAGAYLRGLQQSGQVIGTLKHFPGLGSVTIDPHEGIPHLKRSLADLERIDWAPYKKLIQQGNVHAIMVTHEIVDAVDATKPASISKQVIQGILRDKMGFQGVIMTDSLTMAGVTDFYTPSEAAVLSIEAGTDLLMGASTPNEVANMIDGIKKAMQSGAISQQRIDESVSRILMMKYAMGLIKVPRQ